MDSDLLLMGLFWYVVFLLSTTCHEAAHALVAKWGGDLTAYHGGQVSLDPLPHIKREPFGMVVVPILSYIVGGWMMGWASVPVDPYWGQRHPRRAAWVSAAGPIANFTLAIIAGILIHIGLLAGVFAYPDSVSFTHVVSPASAGVAAGAATFLSILFSLNLLLGAFNLIPIPPLDGFSAIGLALPEEMAGRLQAMRGVVGQFSMIGVLIAWKVFDPIFDPLYFGVFLKALYPSLSFGA
jgi:Zn-dependent protease